MLAMLSIQYHLVAQLSHNFMEEKFRYGGKIILNGGYPRNGWNMHQEKNENVRFQMNLGCAFMREALNMIWKDPSSRKVYLM
jgi:hypothetical protein